MGCLIPDFQNQPQLEDEQFDTSSQWGREYYIKNFPRMNRTMNDEYVKINNFNPFTFIIIYSECWFSRDFIQSSIKKNEVILTNLLS